MSACFTVGGPDLHQKCVFPFTWKNTTFSGCPIDFNDSTKRWCSTLVDPNGNHVINKQKYGYCSDNCPIDDGK